MQGRHDAVVSHHAEQHDERDHEVEEATEDAGRWNQQSRKVHLLNQIRAADQTVRRLGEPVGEEGPWHEAGEAEDRIGHAVPRNAGETPEEQAEDDHREERLDDCPTGAERRLLVANGDVAPRQEAQQLAIAPDLAQIQRCQAAAALESRDRRAFVSV